MYQWSNTAILLIVSAYPYVWVYGNGKACSNSSLVCLLDSSNYNIWDSLLYGDDC